MMPPLMLLAFPPAAETERAADAEADNVANEEEESLAVAVAGTVEATLPLNGRLTSADESTPPVVAAEFFEPSFVYILKADDGTSCADGEAETAAEGEADAERGTAPTTVPPPPSACEVP